MSTGGNSRSSSIYTYMQNTTKPVNRMYESGVLIAKECRGCNQVLPISSFSIKQYNRDGYDHRCRTCNSSTWYNRTTDDHRKRLLLTRVKSKCKKRDIPFNLTYDDIIIPDTCPILGIPLMFGNALKRASPTDNSPSLDRVIPSLGYVKGNVVVISQRANRIKNDSSLEELVKIVNYYQAAYDLHNSMSARRPSSC